MASPQIVIDLDLQKVVEGKSYTANYLEKAVPNNNFIRLLVRTGQNEAYFSINAESEGKVYFKTLSNVVVTNVGTLPSTALESKLTVFNRCGVCGNGNTTLISFNPTFTGGELRGNRMLPLGAGGTARGGNISLGIKSKLGANASFIIELQNVSGQSRDIGLVLDWYEVTK